MLTSLLACKSPMKYLIYLLAIILLLGINLGLFNNLNLRGALPNLLFLFSLCLILEKKNLDGLFVSFICGLILDFYSGGFFGAFTLAFLALALGLGLFADQLMVEWNWKNVGVAFILSWAVFNIIIWAYGLIAFRLHGAPVYITFRIFAARFPLGLAYNLLWLYPVYWLVGWLNRMVDNLTVRRRGIIR